MTELQKFIAFCRREGYKVLVKIYDDALEEAEQKLPNPFSYPHDRIQIPVMLDRSILEKIELAESIKDSTMDTSIIVFEFIKNKAMRWQYAAP